MRLEIIDRSLTRGHGLALDSIRREANLPGHPDGWVSASMIGRNTLLSLERKHYIEVEGLGNASMVREKTLSMDEVMAFTSQQ